MKQGLIIEDDGPPPRGTSRASATSSTSKLPKSANPFSFFSGSDKKSAKASGSSAAGLAGTTTRPPAPYSIFDEPAGSATTASSNRSATAAATKKAPPAALKTSGTKRTPTTAAAAGASGGSAGADLFEEDALGLMKERLAEQERLKRRAKAQQQGLAPSGGPEERAPSGAKQPSRKKDNPFSFKNFGTGVASEDLLEDEEKDINDEGADRRSHEATDLDHEDQGKPGENPFSFKAFAKKSADLDAEDSVRAKSQQKATPQLPSLSDDEDEAQTSQQGQKKNPFSFPAFSSSSSAPSDVPLPDIKQPSLSLPEISDSEEEDDDIEIPSLAPPVPVNLVDVPDFSLDNGQGNDETEKRLRYQIEELQARLQRAEQIANQERRRAAEIERRALKAEKAQARLRKKEEEETKQLNDVVQAIEHNLKLATARAEKAEAKLLQLQGQLERCTCGQGSIQGDSTELRNQLRSVHEQSVYLSSQLNKAAQEAEAGIKQLMGGAATLRDIAAVLKAIDKMSHVEQTKP